jgi:hypothetical protein
LQGKIRHAGLKFHVHRFVAGRPPCKKIYVGLERGSASRHCRWGIA